MRRHLPRLLMTGALLSPVTLHALGLGEIRLGSALNQPFDAEIELISPTREELESLKVGLAGSDLFTRYGIDRPAFLSGFEFSIARAGDGGTAIKVTSSRPVTEPFVTLLVEASWGRGRLLREYTVLLDPPVFMPAQPEAPAPVATPQAGAQSDGRIERAPAAPVQPEPVQPAPAVEPAAAAPTPTPTPTPEPAPRAESPARPAATRSLAQGGEYVVERNDTLWRIAQAANPGAPSVVNRTMIALFRANPHAFNGNINRLLAGSVLRIPALTEIDAISSSEASVEVARQAAEWSGALPTPSAEEASRLRLVTPEETPAEPAPSVGRQDAGPSPDDAGTGAGAAQQDRRVEIDSETLAGVQRAEDGPAREVELDPEAEVDAEAAPAVPESDEQAAPAAVRTAPAQEEPAGPSLFERLAQHWWVPVVAGLLVVLGLVLAFIRRRREESESQAAFAALEPGESGQRAEPEVDSPGFAPAGIQARSETGHAGAQTFAAASPMAWRDRDAADSFAEQDAGEDFEEDSRPEVQPAASVRPAAPVSLLEPEEAPATETADDTLSSETAVRFDQQDALAEADFHMAYGLYDQAADLVKIAIDREPARRDLKLKLLEIYFVWGNKDLFLDTARGLHATRDDAAAGEWDKVLIMGRQIAGDDPMFQGEAAARVDLVDVNLEGGENRVDVDLFAEPGSDTDSDTGTASTGLDLQLISGEYESPVQALAPAQAGEDLDFLLEDEATSHDATSLDGDTARTIDSLARTQETPTIESPFLDAPTTELASLDSPTIESVAPVAGQLEETALGEATLEETPPGETTLGGSVLSGTALEEGAFSGKGLGDIDPDKTMLAPAFFAEEALRGGAETDRSGQTVREQIDQTVLAKHATDQTAELSIDDLGLDVDALEPSALEDTGSLERDPTPLLGQAEAAATETYSALAETQEFVPLEDHEATQPPSIGSFDRTLEVPRAIQPDPTDTGTIYVDGLDAAEGADADTAERRHQDVDATASMKMPVDFADLSDVSQELGLDLDLSDAAASNGGDTVEQRRLPDADADRFSTDVFAEDSAEEPSIDLDLGDPLSGDDEEPTNKQNTAILELSELDPVTMSEVGTKLDLARAYMDMGDPDGARSILDEVVAEGNPSQKQEAQRLLDSIR